MFYLSILLKNLQTKNKIKVKNEHSIEMDLMDSCSELMGIVHT